LALISPTSGGRSVGIVRLRTTGHGVLSCLKPKLRQENRGSSDLNKSFYKKSSRFAVYEHFSLKSSYFSSFIYFGSNQNQHQTDIHAIKKGYAFQQMYINAWFEILFHLSKMK
jgi:hypothetical protein